MNERKDKHEAVIYIGQRLITVPLQLDLGEFFLQLNPFDPQVPTELKQYVCRIVSHETVVPARNNMESGWYQNMPAVALALCEVNLSGPADSRCITIYADSLTGWMSFRTLLLTYKTHSVS
jgi:hypothetical protein